jgi:hypothetical protein
MALPFTWSIRTEELFEPPSTMTLRTPEGNFVVMMPGEFPDVDRSAPYVPASPVTLLYPGIAGVVPIPTSAPALLKTRTV